MTCPAAGSQVMIPAGSSFETLNVPRWPMVPGTTSRSATSVRTTWTVLTGTAGADAGPDNAGLGATGQKPRNVNPAMAVTSTTPAGSSQPVREPGLPASGSRDDIEASAREVPLACLERVLLGRRLLRQRLRERELALRVRVGPVGHAVGADALGEPYQLLELGLRDRGRRGGRGEQMLARLLRAHRSARGGNGEVPAPVPRVVHRVGETRIAVRPVATHDRGDVRIRRRAGLASWRA